MNATAIVLAAGEGSRMKSAIPKVAHLILGVPIIIHVVESVRDAGVDRVVLVTGHGAETVETLLADTDVSFVRQNERLGTGHAVGCVLEAVGALTGPVVVLAGDVPLVRSETIASLVQTQTASGAACVLLSAVFSDPAGYGRIVRDESGAVTAIVEHKDLPVDMLDIAEGNVGIYCFDGEALSSHLHRIGSSNVQEEYYLTDLVELFVAEGLDVEVLVTDDVDESHGVNSRVQLAEVTRVLQRRINEGHMLAGVTMTDPELVWIGPHVEIGQDTVIEPMTFLFGETKIGEGCVLGPDTRISDSVVGEGCNVDSSIVDSAALADRVRVGPRAYLRPGTVLEDGAKAGSCVEIKNSTVGEGSKVPHLSYIGDATIGKDVNVGAGSITCNYDGFSKHPTVIEDGAFIGSDTMLVAPVRIGKGAVTGAASAITRDVPAGALGIERSEQREIEDWVARKRARRERK